MSARSHQGHSSNTAQCACGSHPRRTKARLKQRPVARPAPFHSMLIFAACVARRMRAPASAIIVAKCDGRPATARLLRGEFLPHRTVGERAPARRSACDDRRIGFRRRDQAEECGPVQLGQLQLGKGRHVGQHIRRLRDDTPSARSLPACTNGSDVGRLSNITWICPPTASCNAGPTRDTARAKGRCRSSA